jgi:glycosyltransferase involved in cell wall biosynthesis
MKKILCITSHDLNARDYGPVLRNRHIFKKLSELGEVRMVLASRHPKVIENAKPRQGGFELVDKFFLPLTPRYTLAKRILNKFDPHFLDIEGWQATNADRKHLEKLMHGHDLVWVHGLDVANGFNIWRWPNAVLDVDDVPSTVYGLRLLQATSFSEKFEKYRKMVLWRSNERFLAKRFNAICVCSDFDRFELGGQENIFVLPNGFDRPKENPVRNPVIPPQIGFVGTFVYWANCDGVRWFIDKVWPLVLEKFPQAQLRLAGEGGEKLFNGSNIQSLGWVADMEKEMANWSLTIVPVLAGGGTRIKILEAFSRKCPVVSTPLGAYGHDVEDEDDLLVADSPRDFAENCLRILKNPSEGERLAENAWNKFLQNGTWDSQSDCIAKIVRNVCGNGASPESRETLYNLQIGSRKNAKIASKSKPSSPRISVVVPAYNREHCVADTIESVLSQTFTDFEIIAIDDGSSDRTADVLEKFGKRVHLIRQENRGVSAARNTGIRAARGNWIAFLDSDDRWHPEKLERQLNALEKYSARICFTRCVNAQNEPFRDIEFISVTPREPQIFCVPNAVDSVCLSPRHPMIQTMVAEKKILEQVGLFDESFHAAEDAELIFRLSFLSGFLYIDRPLTTIFENSTNSLTYCEELGPMARRNQSYLRLLAHMYWRLADISPEKISVMRKRLGYFISRRAEIACASGEQLVARGLARDGIFFAGSLRDFARCAGILLAPGLVRARAQKKWPI